MGDNFISWLSELSKKDSSVVGEKAANLAELYNAKFPVPNAFCINSNAFNTFLREAKLTDQIKEILKKIDVENTADLLKKSEEIRALIVEAEMPGKIVKEILESYDHFNIDLQGYQTSPGALSILKSAREPIFVAVRSCVQTTADSSFAGIQETFTNIKGNKEIIEKIKLCFASLFNARSIYYRKKKNFEEFPDISVIVQKMINSEKSGVVFSKNPTTNSEEILLEAVFGQGNTISQGKINPDLYLINKDLEIISEKVSDKKIAAVRTSGGQTKLTELTDEKSVQRVLKTHEIKQIAEYSLKIEEFFGGPQEIEFAFEDGNFFILQTRSVIFAKKMEEKELEGLILTAGNGASSGVATGFAKIINSVEELEKIKKGDIVLAKMTNPDLIISMQKAKGILTSIGGLTSNAATLAREMKISLVVNANNAIDIIQEGQKITVDGESGKVFEGIAGNKKIEILPVEKTKTKIKILVDLPEFAERFAKANSEGIGLVRIEKIIAASGRHPLYYELKNRLDEYSRIISVGLEKIARPFNEKPIWIRTSDIRSDEYSKLEGAPTANEKNPLLGSHGIRFSLKHEQILKAELKAIKELVGKNYNIGVTFPQIISVDEIKKVKKILEEVGLEKTHIGIIVETPASSVIIKDLCEEKINFVIIGLDALTQYTLAVDKFNEETSEIYDEMNWAVLKQISRVIRECKNHKIETSIFGQGLAKREMLEYLVKQGIDSISVNTEDAKNVSEILSKVESEKAKTVDGKVESVDNMKNISQEIDEIKNLEQERILKMQKGTVTEIVDLTPKRN